MHGEFGGSRKGQHGGSCPCPLVEGWGALIHFGAVQKQQKKKRVYLRRKREKKGPWGGVGKKTKKNPEIKRG